MHHVYGHSGNLGNECADHAAELAHLGSSLATMLPRVGLDTTLTLLNVSMGATASVKLWNATHSNTHCGITQGLTLALLIVFFVLSALLSCAIFMRLTCSQPFVFAFSGSLLSQQVMDRLPSSASTASSIDDYFERSVWNPLL